MKKILFFCFLVFLFLSFVWFYFWQRQPGSLISPWLPQKEKPRTLEKYSFENLRLRDYAGNQIKLEKVIKEEKSYTSWLFSFQADGKKITGQANIPKAQSSEAPASPASLDARRAGGLAKEDRFPVVVMVRGYVDDTAYFTGAGTYKAAGVFAENGFITLAPDFLGFGGSDSSSPDILEARFERPITILNLLASVETLAEVDPKNVFLWGHSNGGQIALSVLEISQKTIPTTLWAPVTRGFPASVTLYIGEMDDKGLKVQEAIDEFLNIYDPRKYSIDNYFTDIKAPLQTHQGTADTSVGVSQTNEFVQTLESLGKEISYYQYRRNDHNLKQSWDLVVARDLTFFRKNLML